MTTRLALLRRPPVSLVHWDAVIQVEELILDTRMHEVRQDGVRLELTAREFGVLSYLMRHAGKVIPSSSHRMTLSNPTVCLNSELNDCRAVAFARQPSARPSHVDRVEFIETDCPYGRGTRFWTGVR